MRKKTARCGTLASIGEMKESYNPYFTAKYLSLTYDLNKRKYDGDGGFFNL